MVFFPSSSWHLGYELRDIFFLNFLADTLMGEGFIGVMYTLISPPPLLQTVLISDFVLQDRDA